MTFGVDGKYERRENSNGSVLVLESYVIAIGLEVFGGIIGEGVSESELLDEKVIRLRLDIDEDFSSVRL